jgi:hypothetical protein
MAPPLRTMIWLISAALSAAAPASASDGQTVRGPYCVKVPGTGFSAPPASRACDGVHVAASSATWPSLYVRVSEHVAESPSLNLAAAADAAEPNSGESLLRRFTRRAKPPCGNVLALD